MKIPGYELRVVEALREHGLVERTLISGMFTEALARIRAAEPALRLGWSVPRVRRDYTTDMLTAIPALAILTGYRAMLPGRARGRCARAASTRSWRTGASSRRALVRAVREGGGELYVWTVDDAARIAKLTAMGVDGIITNDPRLFERARRRRGARHGCGAGAQPIRQRGGGEPGGVGAGEALAPGAGRARGLREHGLAVAPLEADDAAQREGRLAGDRVQLEAAPGLARGGAGADVREARGALRRGRPRLSVVVFRYCRRKRMYIVSCALLVAGHRAADADRVGLVGAGCTRRSSPTAGASAAAAARRRRGLASRAAWPRRRGAGAQRGERGTPDSQRASAAAREQRAPAGDRRVWRRRPYV